MNSWKEPISDARPSLLALPLEELQKQLAALGQPAFRARQVFAWLHEKRVTRFEEMTNLPAALREELARHWRIGALQLAGRQQAKDGTQKLLLRLHDGHCIEAVIMQYRHGASLCVSSQVGCRMGCRFCASTVAGFVRNLDAGEMAGQLYAAQQLTDRRIDHLVLMGIGEPLDNYDEVLSFISIITHPAGANLSGRNISLSTCGVVPGIERLAQQRLGLTLSVSLHAADDATRDSLMPVNKTWPLQTLLAACRDYRRQTGRRISFEYALAAGQNDGDGDVAALVKLLAGMDAHVNLIPVNPVEGTPFTAGDRASVDAFAQKLRAAGVNTTVRRRLGADIDAACGQLRLRELRENQP